jgi:outer membrane protein assembly factor BamD (BamD/ComL family)
VALRRADFAAAAEAFARIESAQSNEPLVEDARFWRAVALGRAGQTQAEAVALERFLALHPGSPRAGEASAILGWLLIKQGRIAEAEQRFTTAAHDLREEVKHSAQAGLSQIQKQRAVQPAPATQ